MHEDELYHYGVLGMKWGRRKSRSKSSTTKRSKKTLSKKEQQLKKIKNEARKQKIKNIAKTSAKITGAIASAAILGYAGSVGFNAIMNELNNTRREVGNIATPQLNNSNRINKDVRLLKPGVIGAMGLELQSIQRRTDMSDEEAINMGDKWLEKVQNGASLVNTINEDLRALGLEELKR